MNLRPIEVTDTAHLLEIWNEACEYDFLTQPLLQEKLWGDLEFDSTLAFALEKAGELVGFAIGVERSNTLADKNFGIESRSRGFVKLLAVVPKFQRCGIGSKLLIRLEQEFAKHGVHQIRIAESAPNYLTPGIDKRYQAAEPFLVSQGFEHFETSVNLNVRLLDVVKNRSEIQQEIVAQSDRGVTVRRAAYEDRAALKRFLDANWPTWNAELDQGFANKPISVHLALRGQNVIAFAAYDTNNIGTGWFGPMGTDPSCRKTGIGGLLLHCCLADIANQGLQTATIAWAAHLDFYERSASAKVSRTFLRWRKQLR